MTHTADLIRRLREECSPEQYEAYLTRWDRWRANLIGGDLSDGPRMGFESVMDAKNEIISEAVEALTTLQSQVSLARRAAIEECAKVCDRSAMAHEIGLDAMGADDSRSMAVLERMKLADDIAARLRSLPAELDVDAMVEKWARIMWIDTSDKDYWDHVDDVTRNIYRSNARAVLSTILGEGK